MATDNSKPTTTAAPAAPTPAATPTVAPATAATVSPVQKNAPQQLNDSPKSDTMSLNQGTNPNTTENTAKQEPAKQETVKPEVAQPVAQESDKKITAEKLKGLSVDQLDALLVQGVHNAEETQAINNAKEQAGGGGEDEHFAENMDGEQAQAKEDDDKGPFKEDDIIKYMYNDWLIGGANWLWKKSAEKLDKAYFRTRNAIAQANREKVAKERSEGKKVETKQAHNEVDEKCTAKMSQNSAFFGSHNDSTQANIAKAQEGKLEETTFDEGTKKLLGGLPEGERKAFCKSLSQSMENLHNNLTNVEQSSAMITKAQMAAELCQDPKAFDGKDKDALFDAYQKKNKTLLCQKIDQEIAAGRDPTKFMNKTLKLATKASEQADKNIEKGRYAELGNKPGKNSYLDEINKSLGTTVANNGPKGIYEQFNEDNNIDRAMQKQLENTKAKLGEIPNRRANNEARQDKLIAMYGKIAARDPSKAVEMNRRISGLRVAGPESGVVKADRIAETKIADNSAQRKMSEMLGANR